MSKIFFLITAFILFCSCNQKKLNDKENSVNSTTIESTQLEKKLKDSIVILKKKIENNTLLKTTETSDMFPNLYSDKEIYNEKALKVFEEWDEGGYDNVKFKIEKIEINNRNIKLIINDLNQISLKRDYPYTDIDISEYDMNKSFLKIYKDFFKKGRIYSSNLSNSVGTYIDKCSCLGAYRINKIQLLNF